MLWVQLLQNTICCGTLHFTSYRFYQNSSLGEGPVTPTAGKWSSLPHHKPNKEEV
ncbi:MAG: hypothetical protein FOGNACKC_04258 [Anaerolineae bacterium]|nr:hypothetical protein [Anaerolineae bacterium]